MDCRRRSDRYALKALSSHTRRFLAMPLDGRIIKRAFAFITDSRAMSISTPPLPGTTCDPLYPDSDGEPMGETDYHVLASVHLFSALRRWYRGRQDIYVAANMLLYYEEGNPSAFRGPDLMVSKGVRGNHARRSFRIWEEGVAPAVIIEITSKKTWREDTLEKPLVYASLGVKEYFLFDPDGIYLRPPLQGFILASGKYMPLDVDEAGQIVSRELGLRLAVDEHLLRLIDPVKGIPLPTDEELEQQARLANRAIEKAKQAERKAKAKAEEFKREVDEAKRQAEAQRQRSVMLEAELARLRGMLPPNQYPKNQS
jgi:Uma2 family endonuclease